MKTRIFKNWKTTAIGIGVLIFGGVALFMGKITGAEFLGFVTTAAPFIVAKDSLLEGFGAKQAE